MPPFFPCSLAPKAHEDLVRQHSSFFGTPLLTPPGASESCSGHVSSAAQTFFMSTFFIVAHILSLQAYTVERNLGPQGSFNNVTEKRLPGGYHVWLQKGHQRGYQHEELQKRGYHPRKKQMYFLRRQLRIRRQQQSQFLFFERSIRIR